MPRRRSPSRPSADYEREDATLRGVWLASSGAADAPTIQARTGCSPRDAHAVALVRTYATPELVSAWLDARALTWRQLARIALVEAPADGDGQLSAARAVPAYGRFLAARAKTPLQRVK